MPNEKGLRGFLINIMIMTFAAALFFLLIELTTRIVVSIYTRDAGVLTRFNKPDSIKVYDLKNTSYLSGKDLYYKGTSNLTYRDGGGYIVTYNSKGYRTKEFEDLKSSTRIACFGESSTWGAGCNNDETWPFYLQRGLDEIMPGRYEVINAGFGSYNTGLILNLFKNEFVKYRPDIIILYCGYNEHTGGLTRLFRNTSKIQVVMRKTDLFLKANSSFYLVLSRLLYKGMSFGIVTEGGRIVKIFKENLNEIINICEVNNIKCVIVKQPLYVKSESPSSGPPGFLYSKYYGSPYFNEDIFKKIESDIKNNLSYVKYGKTYYYQQLLFKSIDGIKSENGEITVVDFVNNFIGEQERTGKLFLDVVHLSPEGNKLLVKDMLDDGEFNKILRAYNK